MNVIMVNLEMGKKMDLESYLQNNIYTEVFSMMIKKMDMVSFLIKKKVLIIVVIL